MKAFLGLLFFVLTFPAAFAAVPGNAPILTIAVAGQSTQALSIPISSLASGASPQIFSIFSGGSNTVSNDYYPFYKNGLAYQVTSGKTAYCFNFRAASSGSNYSLGILSATASFAYGATSITGGVYLCGSASSGCIVAGSPNTFVPTPGGYSFASATYPGMLAYSGSGTNSFYSQAECFEQ